MFKSLSVANLYQSIVILSSIVGLAMIGGLAIFCFTKAFGIVFLGNPRSENASIAKEVSRIMIFPQFITIVFIMLIGLASVLFVKPVFNIISQSFALPDITLVKGASVKNLTQISIISGIFITTIIILLIYRHFHLKTKQINIGPTWGCGYTTATVKQQYTATSYAYNYNHLAKPLLQTKKIMNEIMEDEIFPTKRTFKSHSEDVFKKILIDKPIDWFSSILKKIAVMQTGQIQHYILYAFVFILFIFLLTYFNFI
jgi:hydrogenase-4 component B